MTSLRHRRPIPQALLASAALLTILGCYRHTGISRGTVTAYQIPAQGGDGVRGKKAIAGPGDFYMGNDSVEMCVDGKPFANGPSFFGASSGGAVLDIGVVSLDSHFHRVSRPSDNLDYLGMVLNQDPDLPIVIDRFLPRLTEDQAVLEMEGGVLDTKGKLGAIRDAQGRVSGLKVLHRISLGKMDRYFQMETSLSNVGSTSIPAKNVADFLRQRGGGYRFNLPVSQDLKGKVLSNWGLDLPGSDWTQPLDTAVQAPLVCLMGTEPSANSVDEHLSLGFMPENAEAFAVTSDPQTFLRENRPVFPEKLAIGSLPVSALAPGQKLVFQRRLYAFGGPTRTLYSSGFAMDNENFPAQATGAMNLMAVTKSNLSSDQFGVLSFTTAGLGSRGGPLPTEIRIERNYGTDAQPQWRLERLEYQDGGEINNTATLSDLFVYLLPATYRIVIAHREKTMVYDRLVNTQDEDRPNTPVPITLQAGKTFRSKSWLSPELPSQMDPYGQTFLPGWLTRNLQVKTGYEVVDSFQPVRLTFCGENMTPDPNHQRQRRLASYYDQYTKQKIMPYTTWGYMNPANYLYVGGNSLFSSNLSVSGAYSMPLMPGQYTAYASRGPLSPLEEQFFEAEVGQSSGYSMSFILFQSPLPSGWYAFDVPGPSQATTGGMLSNEIFSSALAEDVQLIARIEEDQHPDAPTERAEFRSEFETPPYTSDYWKAVGSYPYALGGRSSRLKDAQAVALFTPTPMPQRASGARPNQNWTLADFQAQAEGKYFVVLRPRGPEGLFSLKQFDPTIPLGTGVNAWWKATGPYSLGKTTGEFDALELLRGEGCQDPTTWFEEFKQVRRDWLAILSQQGPDRFTKALGLSSARFSLDTPVGLARTYVHPSSTPDAGNLDPLLQALRQGQAVVSTGPLLDVKLGSAGPGSLTTGTSGSLTIQLWASEWTPVDEVRILVNGQLFQTLDPKTFSLGEDPRQRTVTIPLTLASNKDAFVVVEAGVPLTTSGHYKPGSPWNRIQKGIYPIAVTNPIFVDTNGGGYTPPGL